LRKRKTVLYRLAGLISSIRLSSSLRTVLTLAAQRANPLEMAQEGVHGKADHPEHESHPERSR
jgi:hypothetical protein